MAISTELSVALDSSDAVQRINAVTDCAQRASAAVADLRRAIVDAETLEIGIAIIETHLTPPPRRNRFIRAIRVLSGRE